MQKTDKGQHFSYALGYNSNDYTAIGGATPLLGGVGGGLLPTPIAQKTENGQLKTDNLFNGNISTWASKNSTGASGTLDPTWTQQFTYDQLNRITSGTTQGGTRNYRNAYNYDANGNILSLKRYDLAGAKIDSLVYNYHNIDAGYKLNTNKLRSVDELATATGRTDDIEDQNTDNYQYDEIGNLIKDEAEEIEKIEWNVQGKIERITRKKGSIKADLAFNYNATGKRISKTVFGKNAQGTINHTTITYYIHDATGNTMATYNVSSDAPTLALQEQNIYGSSRLGLLTLQGKQYELTDHLGNVRTVINENNTVASATDYYPFGMVAKSFSNGYRYGFNGKENDKETKTQDYGFRIYNPGIAKFLSVDPLTKKYPFYTPYQFAGNMPIWAIDLDGLEELKVTDVFKKTGFFGTFWTIISDNTILKNIWFSVTRKDKVETTKVYIGILPETESADATTFDFQALLNLESLSKDELAEVYSIPQAKENIELLNKIIEINNLDKGEIIKDLKNGKKVFAIMVNPKTIEDKSGADGTKTILHEIKAHLKNFVNGKEKSAKEEHYEYFNYEGNPGYLDTFPELKSGTSSPSDDDVPANSDACEIHNEIECEIQEKGLNKNN